MLKSIAFGILLVTSAFAVPSKTGFCGSVADPKEVAAAQERLSKSPVVNGTHVLKAEGAFTVPIHFHIFYDQNNPRDGYLSDAVINEQMNVINAYFQQVRLYFVLAGVNRIPVSYNLLHGVVSGSQAERQIKQRRVGNAQTLNIYTVGPNSDKVSGWATFPWNFQGDPQYDGIVIKYVNLPGGSSVGYNTGKITVHEIGHWVGLLHTFEGGCSGGDYVDDTPAEASPADGCPRGRDTCAAPGLDPIDNMMDYSDDACRIRFTPGQYSRLANMLYQYRGINLY